MLACARFRTGHLLGIHKNLRRLFSHNRNLAFDDHAFLESVWGEGLSGLMKIMTCLDEAAAYSVIPVRLSRLYEKTLISGPRFSRMVGTR